MGDCILDAAEGGEESGFVKGFGADLVFGVHDAADYVDGCGEGDLEADAVWYDALIS